MSAAELPEGFLNPKEFVRNRLFLGAQVVFLQPELGEGEIIMTPNSGKIRENWDKTPNTVARRLEQPIIEAQFEDNFDDDGVPVPIRFPVEPWQVIMDGELPRRYQPVELTILSGGENLIELREIVLDRTETLKKWHLEE